MSKAPDPVDGLVLALGWGMFFCVCGLLALWRLLFH